MTTLKRSGLKNWPASIKQRKSLEWCPEGFRHDKRQGQTVHRASETSNAYGTASKGEWLSNLILSSRTHRTLQDVEFLKQMKIMDYSLLIGIHDAEKRDSGPAREESISDSEYQEDKPDIRSRSSSMPEPRDTPSPLQPAASDPGSIGMFTFDHGTVQDDDSSDDEESGGGASFDPL